ncbi:MAG: 50S ribosomal protein L25 [Alphaproteobacteria bacterium]|nr:50S ribosomal protein L25 [Alphaproteobacteria bacterium]MCB9696522.1 50S ribosomal protein L25 [Alphaproteobacteria bacterium]
MDLTLEATPRATTRKGPARKARAAGSIPAVVYGPQHAATPVSLDPSRLLDIFKQTGDRNTVVGVKIGDGAPVSCMVREVQRHPVSRALLHVDLYAVPEHDISVRVPLVPVGRPKGALIGGKLRTIRRDVWVRCKYDRIPKGIEVDVSHLDVQDVIRVSQVVAGEGIEIVYDADFPVLSCVGKVQKEAGGDK